MSNQAQRESTLAEYVGKLREGQPNHRAVREYDVLMACAEPPIAEECECRGWASLDPMNDHDRDGHHPNCEHFTSTPDAEGLAGVLKDDESVLPNPVVLLSAEQPSPQKPEKLLSSTPIRRPEGLAGEIEEYSSRRNLMGTVFIGYLQLDDWAARVREMEGDFNSLKIEADTHARFIGDQAREIERLKGAGKSE